VRINKDSLNCGSLLETIGRNVHNFVKVTLLIILFGIDLFTFFERRGEGVFRVLDYLLFYLESLIT